MTNILLKRRAGKTPISGLVSRVCLLIIIFGTACVGKYKETIDQLEYQLDSLNVALYACTDQYTRLVDENALLNEEFHAEVVQLRSDFIDMVEVYRQVAYNQAYIEEAIHKLKVSPDNLSQIDPEVFRAMEEKRQNINILLTQASSTLEHMESKKSSFRFDPEGAEQRRILVSLREQLELERTRFQETTRQLTELSSTINYLKLKLQISEDSCGLYYRTVLEQRNLLKTQKQDFEQQLMMRTTFFQRELAQKEQVLSRLDSVYRDLRDTIYSREDTIAALRQSLRKMTNVFYVILDKSSAKKMNFLKSLNQGRLKEDFRRIILDKMQPEITNKYKRERIICNGPIRQVLPNRPTHSYQILDGEVLFIQNPEAFWSYDDVLVIVTD